MSKLLSNLVKYSLLPAALMISGKLLGIYLAANIYQIPLSLDNENMGLFTVQLYTNSDYNSLTLNSFSNIVMVTILSAVLAIFFLRYITYIKIAGNPRTIVKVSKLNLLHWATDKNNSFLKLLVFTFFEIIACFLLVKDSLTAATYEWLWLPAGILVVLLLWALIRVFEIESSKVYPVDNSKIY